MKRLLVLVLISFQLGSFAGNSKSYVSAEQAFQNTVTKDAAQIKETSSFEKYVGHLTHLHYFKNVPGYRTLPFVWNTNNTLISRNTIIQIKNTFLSPHDFYHKPIGLLLIFPQHYFW